MSTIKANTLGSFNLSTCRGQAGAPLRPDVLVGGVRRAARGRAADPRGRSYGGFDILDPRASYSEGKRAAETIASVYAAQHGIDTRIVRFGHVYGPGMALDDGRVQADFPRR